MINLFDKSLIFTDKRSVKQKFSRVDLYMCINAALVVICPMEEAKMVIFFLHLLLSDVVIVDWHPRQKAMNRRWK